MKPAKPYLLGVWVMLVVFVLRLSMFVYIYYAWVLPVVRVSHTSRSIRYFSFIALFWILLPIAESVIYWLIRHKIWSRLWVHLHIWMYVAAFVLLPVLVLLITLASIKFSGPSAKDFRDGLGKIQLYIFVGLVAISHIFFIATIVKSFSQSKEVSENDAPGLLDEFIT